MDTKAVGDLSGSFFNCTGDVFGGKVFKACDGAV
ncbi:hypothetical protein JOD44_000629 [Salimicrobium jeotgali]|nr:hypothetical protein [Salimicrobium jeotgali]